MKELTLTEHECELIKDVISPSEIDVDFNSIGSLEDIKSKYQLLRLPPYVVCVACVVRRVVSSDASIAQCQNRCGRCCCCPSTDRSSSKADGASCSSRPRESSSTVLLVRTMS